MVIRLFCSRCTYGANFCTCSAAQALVSIDLVLSVTLGNSTYRALACARAAGVHIAETTTGIVDILKTLEL